MPLSLNKKTLPTTLGRSDTGHGLLLVTSDCGGDICSLSVGCPGLHLCAPPNASLAAISADQQMSTGQKEAVALLLTFLCSCLLGFGWLTPPCILALYHLFSVGVLT